MSSAGRARVTVPDVVGLTVVEAASRAGLAGLKLSQVDPDGPPLSALTWPHGDRFEVLHQSPGAGENAREWDSLVVHYAPAGGTSGVREPVRPSPPSEALPAVREAEVTS